MPHRKHIVLVLAPLAALLTACQGPSIQASDAISPEGFTPAEYQDAAWRSIMGEYPDAVRPDVAVVRVISNEDFPTIYTDCMLEQGYAVTVSEDTSFEADVPPDQEEPFSLAMYVCEAEYPRPFILTRTDDEASGRALYVYYRDDLIACLTELGYTPGPLPSEDVFIQNLNTMERYDPYASLILGGGMDIDAWNEANGECPQRPE